MCNISIDIFSQMIHPKMQESLKSIKTEFVSEIQTDPEGVKWVIKNL